MSAAWRRLRLELILWFVHRRTLLLALAAAFAASRALASALAPWPALIAGGLAGMAAAGVVVFVLGRGSVWPELVRDLRGLALGPAYGRVPQ